MEALADAVEEAKVEVIVDLREGDFLDVAGLEDALHLVVTVMKIYINREVDRQSMISIKNAKCKSRRWHRRRNGRRSKRRNKRPVANKCSVNHSGPKQQQCEGCGWMAV
jgi:hypothetical protein